jgi:cyanate lyase
MAEREVGRSAAGCVQFGDGIVSAINFSVQLEKKPHPAGDRPIH